jgi:hypothetical protein
LKLLFQAKLRRFVEEADMEQAMAAIQVKKSSSFLDRIPPFAG